MTSFKARVEQSSLGTRGGKAARSSVTTRTAAQVVARAAAKGQPISTSTRKK
jgi:hypothetical protein